MFSAEKEDNPAGNGRDIVLVTGQPGIEKIKCLERIANCNGESKKIILICLEEMLTEIYKGHRKGLKGILKRDSMKLILGEPPAVQNDLWTEAFDQLLKTVGTYEDNKVYAISFHATFYHQRNKQFLSPISIKKLDSLRGRIKGLLMFIDDCFDVNARLSEEGEMFAPEPETEIDDLEWAKISVKNVLTILHWREIEFAISKLIAEYLNVRPFMIATKHPARIICKFFTENPEDLKLFYLAHAISPIREEANVNVRSSEYPGKLKDFAEHLINACPNVILLIPDTIDEYRIKKDVSGNINFHQIWPLPFEDDWCAERELKSFYERKEYLLHVIENLNPEERKNLTDFIDVLFGIIRDQIGARDLNLVSQSHDGIIVCMPHWDGYPAAGSAFEAGYNKSLYEKCQEKNRKTYVLETKGNIAKLRVNKLLSGLGAKIQGGLGKDEVEKIRRGIFKNQELLNSFFSNDWDLSEIRRDRIEPSLPRDYRFKDNGSKPGRSVFPGGVFQTEEDNKEETWKKLEKEVKGYHQFVDHCISPEDEYIITDVIDSAVRNLIEKLRAA